MASISRAFNMIDTVASNVALRQWAAFLKKETPPHGRSFQLTNSVEAVGSISKKGNTTPWKRFIPRSPWQQWAAFPTKETPPRGRGSFSDLRGSSGQHFRQRKHHPAEEVHSAISTAAVGNISDEETPPRGRSRHSAIFAAAVGSISDEESPPRAKIFNIGTRASTRGSQHTFSYTLIVDECKPLRGERLPF
ncbi:hypothetical protein Zmor_013468 [Zophobas morio]|uniref:Uncharacterized protein n=1 Tax=Zophobas morio TaxID=2755281 RepID=A0AA38IDK2_9CUCU|nr:hypothetical protein Zmor_013468 [Zophobas morio]